jgi:3-oxoacyl-[acyl-carrier protein] reductase
MRLSDKVAVITGAGSGIGRATAYLFAKEGAKVVVSDMIVAGGEETVATIKKNGGKAEFVKTDVTKAAEAENLAKVAVQKFGGIDILVNNAGTFAKPTPIEEMDEASWDRVFAVNVKGIMLISKYAIPHIKKATSGAIVNIASMAGITPDAAIGPNGSSKGAVITLTKIMALELAPKTRVNCICPTVVATAMANELPDELKKKIVAGIPMGRFAQPEEIAFAALYLACAESSMVTGFPLWVDGGSGI